MTQLDNCPRPGGVAEPDRERSVSAAFVTLADSLAADDDTIDRLERLVAYSVQLLAVEAAGAILAHGPSQPRSVATSSDRADQMQRLQLRTGQGPSLDCVHTGAPVGAPDLSDQHGRWPRFVAAAREHDAFASIHCLPLRLRGQVIGALNLLHDAPAVVPDADLALAQALADMATIAILSARTLRRGEVLAERLQTTLDNRIAIEQAKGVIAQTLDVGMEEAFETLRGDARARNLPPVNGRPATGRTTTRLDPVSVAEDASPGGAPFRPSCCSVKSWIVLESRRAVRQGRHRGRRAHAGGEIAVQPGEVKDLTVAISEASKTVMSSRSRSQHGVLPEVVAAAVRAVPGADGAGVTQVDRDGNVTALAPSSPWVEKLDQYQVDLADGPCVTAARNRDDETPMTVRAEGYGDVVQVADMAVTGRAFWPRWASAAAEAGVGSLLSFSMAPPGEHRSALNFYARDVDAFTPAGVLAGEAFAAQTAIALFGARRAAELHRALETRDVIGQAKGILMERFQISADAAFSTLVRASQDTNVKLADVARWLTDEVARGGESRDDDSRTGQQEDHPT